MAYTSDECVWVRFQHYKSYYFIIESDMIYPTLNDSPYPYKQIDTRDTWSYTPAYAFFLPKRKIVETVQKYDDSARFKFFYVPKWECYSGAGILYPGTDGYDAIDPLSRIAFVPLTK